MKRKTAILAALLLAAVLLLTGCGQLGRLGAEEPTEALTVVTPVPAEQAGAEEPTEALTVVTAAPTEQAGPIIEPQAIADYLFQYGKLPDNFITKDEAQALGWDSSRNYVSDVAPGKSIGGSHYSNFEGNLPAAKGRTFLECDCNYTGGKRGAERLVYSNDGHVWYTPDHYETFTELFPSN